MSIFGSIMSKLGFGKDKVEEAVEKAQEPTILAEQVNPAEAEQNVAPVAAAIEPIDVTAHLEGLAAGSGLNWKTSIVDLLKVLGLDSSIGARKELATELGCPADKLADSASMNIWLHKTVLQKLAENGGNIPQELL